MPLQTKDLIQGLSGKPSEKPWIEYFPSRRMFKWTNRAKTSRRFLNLRAVREVKRAKRCVVLANS
jgi:hypothetical protein